MNKLVLSFIFLTYFLSGCWANDSDDRMNLVIYSGDGNIEGVREYIPKVSTLNYVSLKGSSPLHAAAYNGHLSVVELLLSNGASCIYENSAEKTAFTVAVEQNKTQVLEYFKTIQGCAN